MYKLVLTCFCLIMAFELSFAQSQITEIKTNKTKKEIINMISKKDRLRAVEVIMISEKQSDSKAEKLNITRQEQLLEKPASKNILGNGLPEVIPVKKNRK